MAVNGQPRYARELKQIVARLRQDLGETPLIEKAALEALKRRAVQEMIETALLEAQAHSRGIIVTDSEVRQLAAELHAGADEQRKVRLLRDRYQSDDDWLAALRAHLVRERAAVQLFPADLSVSEARLREYFTEHAADFLAGEQVHLYQIVVKDEARARDLSAQLSQNPTRFAELARQYSVAPEAERGGDLGFVEREVMPQGFEPAFNLEAGQVSRPVHTEYGYHVFYVRQRRSRAEPPTFEALRPELERAALRQAQETAYYNGMAVLLREAKVELNQAAIDAIFE